MNKSIAAAVVGIIAAVIVLLVVFLPTANDRQPLEPGPDRPKATVPPEQVLLGETPKDPAEFLVWAATAPSSRVNEDAIEAIGSLSGSWTDEALAALLVTDEDGDYEDDEFAGAALLALARRGNPDLPRLEQLIEISDEDWDIDAMIVTAFGEIPGEKSLSFIVMMMNREDPYEDVLMAAIPALAKHGTPDATDAIKSLLDNEEEDVQATAAAVLLRFGDADAERMMDAFIADPDGSGWDEEVVAAALGVEGSATAVPVLTRLVRSEIWDTRQLAARSLGETKLPAARETLEKVLAEDDDEDVKTTAAAALIYGFGDSSGVEFLTTAVKESKDYEVVVEAIRALSVAGGSKDLFQAAWDRKVTRVEHLLVKVWAAHALLKTP